MIPAIISNAFEAMQHQYLLKNRLFLFLIFTVIGFALALQSVTAQDEPTYERLEEQTRITAAHLQNAGFKNVVQQHRNGSDLQPPVHYFLVDGSHADATTTAWEENARLVSVYVRPITQDGWSYNNDDVKFTNINGRIQARRSNATHYFVITGPQQDLVTELLRQLTASF